MNWFKKNTLPFYPYLFALNSVILPFSVNSNELPLIQIVRPMIISIVMVVIITIVAYFLTKDIHRGALMSTPFLFLIFYFGYISVNRKLVIIWSVIILICLLISLLRWIHIKKIALLTKFLNVISIFMFIVPGVLICKSVINISLVETFDTRLININGKPVTMLTNVNTKPDIYYIIVDGYTRSDILQDYFDTDNSDFIQFLQHKGFYIATHSQSNYIQTVLSLASSLNMKYIEFDSGMSRVDNKGILMDAIHHSRLRQVLEGLGYSTVVISSGWLFTDIQDARIYQSPYPRAPMYFENYWLGKTAFPVIDNIVDINIPLPSYDTHRAFISYALTALSESAYFAGPKLVFAHIMAPHPPFVFDENGHPITPKYPYFLGDANGFPGSRTEYKIGYTNELIYINKQLELMLTNIFNHSDTEPIIILQADHGSGVYTNWESEKSTCLKERLSILNAIYLPLGGEKALYPTLSPVNTFRIILDYYFGTQLGLYPDLHYFSTRSHPYKFIDVTDRSEFMCQIP
jgi:hypothetical protein